MKLRRISILIAADTIIISLSFFIALLLRFESIYFGNYIDFYLDTVIPVTLLKLAIFYFFNFYKSLWEYASIDELFEIIFGSMAANFATYLLLLMTSNPLPLSMYVLITLMDILLIGSVRFVYRIIRRLKGGFFNRQIRKRVLIVGAGAAGVLILNELRNHDNLKANPVVFIDDNPDKKGTYINGVPVVGNRSKIRESVDKYRIDEIIIALPSADARDRKNILNICKETNAKTRILPGMYELIGGQVNVNSIRDVQIEDLLGREEIKLDTSSLDSFISDKVVLITGGGGSIGSELGRQIIKYNPKKLILIDIYENTLYDFQNELLRKHPDLDVEALIISVRDFEAINRIIGKYKPNIVFHAAAHKHVPLMEENPNAAVKNNVFGTLNVVRSADINKVEKFVLISTDKAVNPTNVMGATKRIAEKIIQTYNGISDTDYVAVRFGNVLGSNGSVIPLFKKQIYEGGPITVTDERVIRFFMTIQEACQLVLQAGAMANGGEIFVLDMGEPVKIIDLARDLIKLSGFEPDVDIKIEIVGLRPGEKLYEELLINSPNIEKTKHNKIFIEECMDLDYQQTIPPIEKLREFLDSDNPQIIKKELSKLVEGYIPYKG